MFRLAATHFFLWVNNFFNVYYKSYNTDESINNGDFRGILFSSFLTTLTIYLDLGKIYKEFSMYFPNGRLRSKRYPDPTLNPA